MIEQIKNKLENNLFNLKEYFKGEEINPKLISNLNSAFELAVRLDVFKEVLEVIEKKKHYIFINKINCENSQGQIKSLDELKKEIEGGIRK